MSRIKNQRGQAVTEYILVLVVVVALILGGMYQLNSAFRVWANNYFGEYLACLLETGELPSIGGAPGDSGICNELFQPFSLANGRPYTPGGGDGSEDQSRGGDSDSGGVRERAARRSGSYVSGGSGGSAFGRGGRSRGTNIPPGRNANRREKSAYTGSTESSVPAGGGYSSRSQNDGRVRYESINTSRIVDPSEESKESSAKATTTQSASQMGQDKSRIRLLKRDIAKTDEVKDEPFTLGNFLRFFIIAAIIIALGALLAGQALQISKNSE